MTAAIDLSLLIIAVVLSAPMLIFCAECRLACLPSRRLEIDESSPRPRTAVLIPAHNEEQVLERTLRRLMPTLGPQDVALVVADNCTDGTAELARDCGASVVERHDTTRRGKGYALEFGIHHLRGRAPQAVVVVDADCDVSANLVETLGRAAHQWQRPVQALNLCEADPAGSPLATMSALAMRFKNLLRPRGMARLGLPCHLMGTGMALPWPLAGSASWAGGNIVEDMQLGLDLAIAGAPARFCPEARISSRVPTQTRAFMSQRTRWEQGHLRTITTQVPRLVWQGIRQRRCDLLALAADLCVPPLSMLMAIWAAAVATAATAAACGAAWTPAAILAAAGLLVGLTVAGGWAVFCRDEFSWRTLLVVPWYMLRKLPIYAGFFAGQQTEWVRTEREPATPIEATASHG